MVETNVTPDVTATAGSGGKPPGPAGRPPRFARMLVQPEAGGLISAIAVFAFFAIMAGSSGFLTPLGTAYWLDTAADLGIIAIPVAMLMIAGEFDLSIGSMVGAASMVTAIISGYFGLDGWIGALCALVVAIGVGLLNGF